MIKNVNIFTIFEINFDHQNVTPPNFFCTLIFYKFYIFALKQLILEKKKIIRDTTDFCNRPRQSNLL